MSQLIPLLPADVAELVVREPEEKGDDYKHMKKMLMKRFRLSAVSLRFKFEGHQDPCGWTSLTNLDGI